MIPKPDFRLSNPLSIAISTAQYKLVVDFHFHMSIMMEDQTISLIRLLYIHGIKTNKKGKT